MIWSELLAKRRTRHHFRFKLPAEDNQKPVTIVARARVIYAKKPVILTLTAADVKRSMEIDGVGNTQTCSMAVCAKRQAKAFGHPVEGGVIDWYYRRAYVSSHVSRENGLPDECYAYAHKDKIAQLNDTKGGQKKLLEDLLKNGDREIRLYPILPSKPRPGRARGKNDGSRSKTISLGKGAKLRFAMANLGGV